QPWWKANFFVREPVLFGTWDGVFTSCMLNIFGVIIFLRTGWVVGNAGVGLSLLIIVITLLVALAPVLSSIGVCERCHVGSGGVYFLLSHVLGQRAGGAISLLYAFGQAVSVSLFCAGLGESLAQTAHWDSAWAVRVIGLLTALAILLVVLAGVKWVVKLQLLLLAILMLSVLDFVIGTFAHTDIAAGFTGYKTENMEKNAAPQFGAKQNFFTVFGVFFPSATGVLSGINMSGDLKDPSSNIPAGTLAALGFRWVGLLYILFAVLLGAVCTREALLTDYMIASKVSLVGVLFLFGLYVSSLSSCLGAQYGAPRVLQVISQDNVVPIIKPLGKERGANKEPYVASIFVAVIAMLFILIGNLNALAPIVTMPFLVTYASIDYAYFKLAMSYDLKQKQKLLDAGCRQQRDSETKSESSPTTKLRSDDGFSKKCIVFLLPVDATEKDDSLEKENVEKDGVPGQEKGAITVDMGSKDHGDEDGTLKPATYDDSDTTKLLGDDAEKGTKQTDKAKRQGEIKRGEQGLLFYYTKQKSYSEEQHINWEIEKQPSSYYSDLCNRWVSLAGAIASLLIMFLIHWGYALANISVTLLVYIYIGQANPSLPKGIAADFSFVRWVQSLAERITRRKPAQQQMVIPPGGIPYGVSTYQLTEDNADFAYRDRRHQSSVITDLAPQ
ncbi:predicted protein, partial [Nematostella vectensis]